MSRSEVGGFRRFDSAVHALPNDGSGCCPKCRAGENCQRVTFEPGVKVRTCGICGNVHYQISPMVTKGRPRATGSVGKK